MYVIKNYLTDETVAIVSREEDAVAMTQSRMPNEPVLIYVAEKPQSEVDSTE